MGTSAYKATCIKWLVTSTTLQGLLKVGNVFCCMASNAGVFCCMALKACNASGTALITVQGLLKVGDVFCCMALNAGVFCCMASKACDASGTASITVQGLLKADNICCCTASNASAGDTSCATSNTWIPSSDNSMHVNLLLLEQLQIIGRIDKEKERSSGFARER